MCDFQIALAVNPLRADVPWRTTGASSVEQFAAATRRRPTGLPFGPFGEYRAAKG